MAAIGFNLAQVEVSTTYKDDIQVIPAGQYKAIVTNSEAVMTKAGGQMLVLTIEVIEGEYKGAKIKHNLNVINANAQVQARAQEKFKELAVALKVPNAEDTTQLHNKPFVMKTRVKEANGTYPEASEPTAYLPALQSVPQAAPVASAAPVQQSAPVADPWAKA